MLWIRDMLFPYPQKLHTMWTIWHEVNFLFQFQSTLHKHDNKILDHLEPNNIIVYVKNRNRKCISNGTQLPLISLVCTHIQYIHTYTIYNTSQYVCTLNAVMRNEGIWRHVVLSFRASGPKHIQVPYGDVSVPERRASADDLAGVPSGGSGELPEQGTAHKRSWINTQLFNSTVTQQDLLCFPLSPEKSCGSCVPLKSQRPFSTWWSLPSASMASWSSVRMIR